ncbi:hypothetical protein BKA80DRAFT_323116 [Phyllosticta citrichinensis]
MIRPRPTTMSTTRPSSQPTLSMIRWSHETTQSTRRVDPRLATTPSQKTKVATAIPQSPWHTKLTRDTVQAPPTTPSSGTIFALYSVSRTMQKTFQCPAQQFFFAMMMTVLSLPSNRSLGRDSQIHSQRHCLVFLVNMTNPLARTWSWESDSTKQRDCLGQRCSKSKRMPSGCSSERSGAKHWHGADGLVQQRGAGRDQ